MPISSEQTDETLNIMIPIKSFSNGLKLLNNSKKGVAFILSVMLITLCYTASAIGNVPIPLFDKYTEALIFLGSIYLTAQGATDFVSKKKEKQNE